MNKYGAKKVEIDGHIFDSILEGRYYEHLLYLMNDGVVESFEMKKSYTLLDKFPPFSLNIRQHGPDTL